MKGMLRSLVFALAGSSTVAYAAESAKDGEGGFLMIVFLVFLGLIIIFQLIPGLALFIGMIKGVFSSSVVEKSTKTPVE